MRLNPWFLQVRLGNICGDRRKSTRDRRERHRDMEIAVVVPVHNGGLDLALCLAAIANSSTEPKQVIVVDDSSTDASACEAAKSHGFDYLRLDGGPYGPAKARNAGVKKCRTDIVLFIDADVVVQTDTVEKVTRKFCDNSEIHALFGSYDAEPAVTTIVSRYKNLLHHFVHQNGNQVATTFWAGCGAVKLSEYNSVGGFDSNYEKPCIEDIEFGTRLTDAGYNIRLCADIQVKHLKHWKFFGMVKTDIFSRAVPWTRLMIHKKSGVNNDLNTGWQSRLNAAVALLLVATVIGIFAGYELYFVAAFLLGVYLAVDKALFSFFLNAGGIKLAVGGALLHLLYYVYASVAFVAVHIGELSMRWFERFSLGLASLGPVQRR